MKFKYFIILFFGISLQCNLYSQIAIGNINDFNDGTAQGWREGGASPNPPYIIFTDGPLGKGDFYLRNISSGQGEPGGKCVMFNQGTGWTGNYQQAGVNLISMHIKNPGTSSLYLRVAFNGMGGVVCSKESIEVHPDTSWKWISFSLDTLQLLSLTMNGNITTTLETVNELRILSSKEPSFTGDQEMLTMDIDNIEASDDMLMFIGTGPDDSSFDQQIEIYPNPTNGVLIIRVLEQDREIHKVHVINSDGEILQTIYPPDPRQAEIQLIGLVPGLYRMLINDRSMLPFSYIN